MRLISGVSALQHLLFRENQLANPLQLIKSHNIGKEGIIAYFTIQIFFQMESLDHETSTTTMNSNARLDLRILT